MGIYERDYVREPARSGRRVGWGAIGRDARRGGWMGWSATTWIIVVCMGVFVLNNVVLRGVVSPVDMGARQVRQGVDPVLVQNGYVDRDLTETGQKAHPIYAVDDQGRVRKELGPIGLQPFVLMPVMEAWGHFSTAKGFFGLEVWRLVTFQFLHANLSHVLLNMLGLYMFGWIAEEALGRKRYLAFYLVCGIFGALLYLLLNVLGQFVRGAPGLLFHDVHVPLVGASAGVFGVLMAAAYLRPRDMLVFPPLPIKVAVYGYVALAMVNLFMAGSNAGGDAAHIGGALAGWYFIRNKHLLVDFFDVLGDSRKPKEKGGGVRRRVRKGPSAAEVDRILAKTREEGIESLSEKERETLAKASKSMRGS